MEIERRLKKDNDHISFLLKEIEHAKLVKRKKGSEVKINLKKGEKSTILTPVCVKKEQSSSK